MSTISSCDSNLTDEKSAAYSATDEDSKAEHSVTKTAETTETSHDSAVEQSSSDGDDSIPEKQLHETAESRSETLNDEFGSDSEDSVDEKVVKQKPREQETIRDRLEKAGVDTNGSGICL